MNPTKLFTIFIFCLLFAACQNQKKNTWHLKAVYHESCSCNAPCPCPFGLPMTNSFCKLNGLLDIQEGEFKQVDLAGIRVLLSGSAGSWGEYYFDEKTSDAQKKALEELLGIINVTGFDTLLKSERTKIEFEEQNGHVRYSTANVQVEMNAVKGAHNKPVKVVNLESKLFAHYIPHLSVANTRTCSDSARAFSFSQKAGFTSKWNLTEKDFE